jgi:ATP-dependent helicase HepA
MILPGGFVEVQDARQFGKVFESNHDRVVVEFFRSIHESVAEDFEIAAVQRAFLYPETRVYFRTHHGERWAMGRIRQYFVENDGSVTYKVRSPNGVDREMPERDLRVRSHELAGDPAEVLALGAAESQIWHDSRWAAREALISLRSAARGLEGLVSAAVELVPHQADAIRRVLSDPLQRYLLADEVGLGKTIEAGAIIAQTLLDDPVRSVLVLLPSSLIPQWTQELRSKFGLDAATNPRLGLLGHDDILPDTPPHLLVIDEAHRCAGKFSNHAILTRMAQGADKLLLLTATPMIGNETTFLGLLRWLDPARWAGESEAAFERHVRSSQDYGRLLLGLRPDASAFLLKQRVASARVVFPDDAVVGTLAERFAVSEQPEARAAICVDLREHIADTYRIHHRLVRARRSDLDGWEFQPRGPAVVREEGFDEQALETTNVLIEDWRAAALVAAETSPETEAALARRYVELLEITGRGGAALAALPAWSPLFDEEAELLAALRVAAAAAEPNARASFIGEVTERHIAFLRKNTSSPPKIVVFTSDAVDPLAEAIRTRLGNTTVISSVSGTDRFRTDPSVQVLVLDQSGEEGLNLHFVDGIIHADLPFSVSRLEQRIGRLDRFGRNKGPIRHVVITPSGADETPWSAWLELLKQGLGIFDRTTSDIQFALDAIERDLWRRMLQSGSASAECDLEPLKTRIAQERQRLDEQYALDQLAMSRDSARALVTGIEAAEEDEADLARRVGGLLKLLQFQGSMKGEVFQLSWARETLLPEKPWRPAFEVALKRPLTWRRRVAEARPDVSLLRPGTGLIEALERLLEWDDRGSAFSTWRQRPGWGAPGEERLVFRLCWTAGPKPVAGAGLQVREDRAGLRRQAQAALPPWTVVQHLDGDLSPLADTALLKVVEEVYQPEALDRGGRDYNLGSRPDWLPRVVDPGSFQKLCSAAREIGRLRLREDARFGERVAQAIADVARDTARRKRRDVSNGVSRSTSDLGAELLAAVADPDVRLDSIGVFVVAGYSPREVKG